MKQIDIVVIGQNYSTSLGLIQAAGEAGYGVGVVHSTVHPVKHQPLEIQSKYVRDYIIIENRTDEKRLLSLIIDRFSSNGQKVVLLPSDDYSAALLDRNLSELEKYFYLPNSKHTAGEVIRCMDKGRQAKMAIEAGLPKAKCWEIHLDKETVPTIPDDMVYPCITKPLKSIGSHKTYIKRCNNRNELEKTLKEIVRERSCSILVEEYINIENEYTVPILAAGDKIYIPVFLKKIRTGTGVHKGVTIAGRVVPSGQFPQIVDSLKQMVRNAGLQGIFDIELLQNGDTVFFNELNLRNGAAGYALTRAGINLPAMWIDYCLNSQLFKGVLSFKEGLSFLNDKAAIENYGAGYMSWKDYRKAVHSVDFRFLYDSGDKAIKRGIIIIEIKTLFSKILRG